MSRAVKIWIVLGLMVGVAFLFINEILPMMYIWYIGLGAVSLIIIALAGTIVPRPAFYGAAAGVLAGYALAVFFAPLSLIIALQIGAFILIVVLLIWAGSRPPLLDGGEMKEFEADHRVTHEQQRQLAFGAVLMTANQESSRTFRMMHPLSNIDDLREAFAGAWGITDKAVALEVLEYLSKAEGHAPAANEIYAKYVEGHVAANEVYKLARLKLSENSVLDLKGLENTIDIAFKRIADLVNSQITTLNITDEEDKKDIRYAYARYSLIDRVNKGTAAFHSAYYILTSLPRAHRYTNQELLAIKDFAAWDLGRVAYIARVSVALGYIFEEDAWEYIARAAELASQKYGSWREYLAAYTLGRALGYGGGDLSAEIRYLLINENSPYKDVEFKG